MSASSTPDPSTPAERSVRPSAARSGGPPRSAAGARAEQFLARVLPGLDDEPAGAARPAGVDAATQARLEAMGAPDRESW